MKHKDNLLKTLKEYSATEKILLLVILVLNWVWFLQQQSRIRYAGMLEEAQVPQAHNAIYISII